MKPHIKFVNWTFILRLTNQRKYSKISIPQIEIFIIEWNFWREAYVTLPFFFGGEIKEISRWEEEIWELNNMHKTQGVSHTIAQMIYLLEFISFMHYNDIYGSNIETL